MTLELVALGVGLVAGGAHWGGTLASALGLVDYYPPGQRDVTFYLTWGFSHTLNLAILTLGYLQWGAISRPTWAIGVGVALVTVGFAIAVAAGLDLGVTETSGLAGELRTGGWYRYSRNPQYVGYLLATAGVSLVVGSPFATVLCGVYALWWLTFPFAEEPWLREQYGEAYERYAAETPRFVGRRTIWKLLGQDSRQWEGAQ